MTERRRSAWGVLADEWDPDHPAIARMRDALALTPTEEPRAPERPAVASGSTLTAPRPATEETTARRGRIAQLVARLRAGDLSARQLLEDLLK